MQSCHLTDTAIGVENTIYAFLLKSNQYCGVLADQIDFLLLQQLVVLALKICLIKHTNQRRNILCESLCSNCVPNIKEEIINLRALQWMALCDMHGTLI